MKLTKKYFVFYFNFQFYLLSVVVIEDLNVKQILLNKLKFKYDVMGKLRIFDIKIKFYL